jgi:lipopolysaccharide transport system permease protein
VLGIGWVMLNPLLEAIVIGFAFTILLGSGEISGKPFSIFLLSGIVMFDLFSRIVNQNTISLIAATGVIKQIYFPREIILLVLAGVELVNFAFAFLALVMVNAFFGTFPHFDYLLLILPATVMIATALALSLFVSVGNMIFRDLQQLVIIGLRLLFYVTVLFSARMATPETAIYGLINPLTALVEFFRSIALYERPPEFITLVWPAILAAVLLYSGYVFFTHHEGRFVDYL